MWWLVIILCLICIPESGVLKLYMAIGLIVVGLVAFFLPILKDKSGQGIDKQILIERINDTGIVATGALVLFMFIWCTIMGY